MHSNGSDRWLLLLWQVDEDADDLSFPAMISQLLEFVLCIVSNENFLPLLQPVLPELAYLTIGGLTDTGHCTCKQKSPCSIHESFPPIGAVEHRCTAPVADEQDDIILSKTRLIHLMQCVHFLQWTYEERLYAIKRGTLTCRLHSDNGRSAGAVGLGRQRLSGG